jgi:hypothetical protein
MGAADELLVWTRIGSEAGEPVNAIVERKEAERQAGGGLFCWGVGNPPSSGIATLVEARAPINVVFSLMRSNAKAIDHSPGSVLRWRAYLDAAGKVRPLPAHVRVTSRGGKDRHYALMCWSDEPLVLSDYCAFDHSVHRNLSGAPIGATQVTALVRRISPDSATPLYRTGFGARLVESYWVKLVEAEPV